MARALNLVGERWALLVVRELLLGPKRFSDLRDGLPEISPNVLSQRLADLVDRGVVERRELGPPVSGAAYELTGLGAALEPVLIALAEWGSRAVPPAPGAELSVDALVLALRTTVRPGHRVEGSFLLRLGPDAIEITVGAEGLTARRTIDPGPVRATITGRPSALRAVVFGGRSRQEAEAGGDVQIRGDRAAARRFLAMFARPQLIDRTPRAARSSIDHPKA